MSSLATKIEDDYQRYLYKNKLSEDDVQIANVVYDGNLVLYP